MNPSAQVHSIEKLEHFRAALARFGVDAQAALETAANEIRRAHAALEERLKFWQSQVIKRQETLAQARAALSHARAIHQGKSVGTIEQELAVRKAHDRLHEAEDKVSTVKRWQRELPLAVKDFEGPAHGLHGFLEADLRQAVVVLANRIEALHAYRALAAPSTTEADLPAASPSPSADPAKESS